MIQQKGSTHCRCTICIHLNKSAADLNYANKIDIMKIYEQHKLEESSNGLHILQTHSPQRLSMKQKSISKQIS